MTPDSDSNADADPEAYVREHRDDLIEIIKHGDDAFVRGLALAAIIEYGEDPDVEDLIVEIERFREQRSEGDGRDGGPETGGEGE